MGRRSLAIPAGMKGVEDSCGRLQVEPKHCYFRGTRVEVQREYQLTAHQSSGTRMVLANSVASIGLEQMRLNR